MPIDRVSDEYGNSYERKRVSEDYALLGQKAKSLGEILRKYPKMQSNSAELYLMSYLNGLGGAKI